MLASYLIGIREGLVAALRGESQSQSAYIVQPRDSALLTSKPTIFWYSAEGGESTLSVVSILSDDGITRDPVEVQVGEVAWPESWPPLEHHSTYVLLLGDQAQVLEETIGKGFWLLDSEEAEQVRSQEARLRASPLTQAAQNLLVAELYDSYGLRAESLTLLSELQRDYASPAVWLTTGRLHLESGLPVQAVRAYNEALALAESTGDLSSAGEAYLGLALAENALGDEASAAEMMQKADEVLGEVGAVQRIREVEAILEAN